MVTSSSRSAAPAPSFEVPDLDFGPLPPARSPAIAPKGALPQSGAHQIRARSPLAPDLTDDFELELDPAASFELQGNAAPPRSTRGNQSAPSFGSLASLDDDFELEETMALEPVAVPIDTRPWPSGRTNEAKPSNLTPEEIAECAGYGNGTPPFYLAPAYVWRVWNRRQELARQLDSQRGELAAREAERDRLLVDLTLSLMEKLEKQDRFHTLLSELAAAKRALDGQEQALATTNSAANQAIDALDTELNRLEVERSERAKVVEKLRRERDARAADRERASAKLKRVRIEMRNATDKARAVVGPEGGPVPAALARLQADLSDMEASLQGELERCEAPLVAANLALDEGELPLTDIERQIAAVRAERAETVAKTRQKVENEVSQTRTAKANYVNVAKRIAFAVLDLKGAVPVDRILLDRVQGADDRVDAHEREVEKLTLALDAYDRGTYGLGIKLALSPFVLAIAFLLLHGLL